MPLAIADIAPVAVDIFGSVSNPRRKFRVAILSEGFLPAEMADFRDAAQKAMRELIETQPFRRFRARIHVVRIDCNSRASAQILRPLTPAPASYQNQTPFDVRFSSTIARGMTGNQPALRTVLGALPGLPPLDATLVIVNSDHVGGEADGTAAWLTLNDVGQTFMHELGHAAFGLLDEYEYLSGTSDEKPSSAGTGSEPVAPNVTRQQQRDAVPWKQLFDPPNILVPTTELGGKCRFDRNARQSVPSGAVGLFEGANHHACGLFRPSAECKMRVQSDDFCHVCQSAISSRLQGAAIDARAPFTLDAEPWTHACAFPPRPAAPDEFFIATYNATTGAFGAYFGDNFNAGFSPPDRAHGRTQLDPGFTTLTCFTAGGEQFVYLEHFLGKRAIFRLDRDALVDAAAPAGLFREFERPAPEPLAVAFSHVVPLTLDGLSCLLHYDRVLGKLELEAFDPGTKQPVTLSSTELGSLRAWHRSFSSLTALTLGGVPHVMGIDATARSLTIARATLPSGPAPVSMLTDTFQSPGGFLTNFQTHALAFMAHGVPVLLTYSALDGVASLYEIRSDQSGVDYVFGWPLTPGAAASFDVGLSAFGFMPTSESGAGRSLEQLWFYNAGLRRFSATRFL